MRRLKSKPSKKNQQHVRRLETLFLFFSFIKTVLFSQEYKSPEKKD